ncbi:pro-pol polyprotein [Lasius niger]|uniref:RNA-directed DNA polymerase n=1 Tax=Lasius niger TaxID=67767 RepID=A0A0J7K9C1_LASNI|nr:pro-pol polyprotein [Lasius niger]
MMHVDALSHIVALTESFPLEKELQFKQLQDPKINIIAKKLESKEDERFELIDGLVFRKFAEKSLFLVPDSMITNIIRIYHDNMAHCGLDKTVKGILSNYWFPSLRKKVQVHIDNCLICLLSNSTANTREGELQITDNPTHPFQTIHTDHFGPLNQTDNGSKHILLVVDAFSRFTWLFATKSTGSKEVVKNLSTLFGIFGNPQILISDRGTAFTSQEFASFLQQ